MSTEISKSLMCVQMRSGVEIWVEADRAISLQNALESISSSKFIRFDDQTFNSADITGIFSAKTMEDFTRRKNGQWKCSNSAWHDKHTKCDCPPEWVFEYKKEYDNAVKNCKNKNCRDGWDTSKGDGGAEYCSCVDAIVTKYYKVEEKHKMEVDLSPNSITTREKRNGNYVEKEINL